MYSKQQLERSGQAICCYFDNSISEFVNTNSLFIKKYTYMHQNFLKFRLFQSSTLKFYLLLKGQI